MKRRSCPDSSGCPGQRVVKPIEIDKDSSPAKQARGAPTKKRRKRKPWYNSKISKALKNKAKLRAQEADANDNRLMGEKDEANDMNSDKGRKLGGGKLSEPITSTFVPSQQSSNSSSSSSSSSSTPSEDIYIHKKFKRISKTSLSESPPPPDPATTTNVPQLVPVTSPISKLNGDPEPIESSLTPLDFSLKRRDSESDPFTMTSIDPKKMHPWLLGVHPEEKPQVTITEVGLGGNKMPAKQLALPMRKSNVIKIGCISIRPANEVLEEADAPGIQPEISIQAAESRQPQKDPKEGKSECNMCGKGFSRPSQLSLHMNIHYLERPFRCDPCGVSFRTKGHLIKHRRSSSHDCKVYLTEAWGVASEENPRPFKCPDCKIAFRIHGHLAKHLRSKIHIMRMECLGKVPLGIYFEMEKSGSTLNEIDTTDCEMSLDSLQIVARKIYGDNWKARLTGPPGGGPNNLNASSSGLINS